jgi:type II secretory pathway component PulJ
MKLAAIVGRCCVHRAVSLRVRSTFRPLDLLFVSFSASPRLRVKPRTAFTLLELLISILISLMVMGATVSLFGIVGDRIANGRAMIELNDRLRNASQLLRYDLRGITVDATVWTSAAAGSGYLEIDKSPPTTDANSYNGLLGYTGDILSFTTHSAAQPFTARAIINGKTQIIESQYAEVHWFLAFPTLPAGVQRNTAPGSLPMRNLYRHMFLIRPDFAPISWNNYVTIDPNNPSVGILNYDLSTHQDLNTGLFNCNSLADCAYRENRFNHSPTSFPFSFQPGFPGPVPPDNIRYGEDVVLTNVVNFDVKVWDPQAEVRHDPDNRPLVPGDPGYTNGTSYATKVTGAYVDLNYANMTGQSYFSGPTYGDGNKSMLAGTQASQGTYDTWCAGYEYYNHSGYSWWGNPQTDVVYGQTANGVNGFANASYGDVGDPGQRVTCAPYPVPLRGLQIKIRVYESGSRQVRETTVVENFVPD